MQNIQLPPELQQTLNEIMLEISDELSTAKLDGYYLAPQPVIHDDIMLYRYLPVDEYMGGIVYEVVMQLPIAMMIMNQQSGQTGTVPTMLQVPWRFQAETVQAAFEHLEQEGEHRVDQAKGLFEKKSSEKQRRVQLAGAEVLKQLGDNNKGAGVNRLRNMKKGRRG